MSINIIHASKMSLALAICTYNNAALLDQALDALERQAVDPATDWAALVVDNNSTDSTPEVVRCYMQRNTIPNLRYVRETKQGLAYARRRAVQETTSDLIAFVDDDCMLAPDWVEQAVAFCRTHPKAGAAGGKVHPVWEVPPSTMIPYRFGQDFGATPVQLPNTGFTYLMGAGLVLNRSALVASRWLDRMILTDRKGSSLLSGGDIEIVLRIRQAGYELWYTPTMHLDHYVPRQRISPHYLRRLCWAVGHQSFVINPLAMSQKPVLKERLLEVWRCSRTLGRLTLSIVLKDILVKPYVIPARQFALYHAMGALHGACAALPCLVDA